MHRRLKINKFVEYINVWKLYICRIHILHASTSENYIFIEYIYLSNTYTTCINVIKNKFNDYNYGYYKLKYIDVFNIHVDKNSTKSRKSRPLVGHINHNTHFYMSSLTRVMTDCIDVWRGTISTYHVMMTRYTSCQQVIYYDGRHATKHFTCWYSYSLHHDHSASNFKS